jgi:rRNA-processing protein FCF1
MLVDAENVRRSRWPNVARDDLERHVREWASREGHDAIVVFEGAESADDWIARQEGPYWLVTSDRELRRRCGERAVRVTGGGAFLELLGL